MRRFKLNLKWMMCECCERRRGDDIKLYSVLCFCVSMLFFEVFSLEDSLKVTAETLRFYFEEEKRKRK